MPRRLTALWGVLAAGPVIESCVALSEPIVKDVSIELHEVVDERVLQRFVDLRWA